MGGLDEFLFDKRKILRSVLFPRPARAFLYHCYFLLKYFSCLKFSIEIIYLHDARKGRAAGNSASRGGVPQAAGRFDLTSTGCRIAASPRERESTRSTGKRASEERLPQQKVGSDAGRPHGGASVSRRAGQHDDAEKAGTTPGHAKVGNATGPMEMLVYLLYRIFRFLTAADQLRRRGWMRNGIWTDTGPVC